MSENKRGRFIVIEGIDGAGKTTQIEILAEKLREEGRVVHVTAEPTASVSGGLLRDALGGISSRTTCEMAALFVLDRIFHNVNPNGINAMLEKGIDVICDRYYYSSLAYQGAALGYDTVAALNLDISEIRTPDVCIFLDLTPEKSLERIGKRGEATEIYENFDYLTKTRKMFFDVFERLRERGERIAVIDASGSPEEIGERVLSAVLEVF